MPRIVDAAIDRSPQVLDERPVEPRIDLPDAEVPVDDDAYGCHRQTTPSPVSLTSRSAALRARGRAPLSSIVAPSNGEIRGDDTGRRTSWAPIEDGDLTTPFCCVSYECHYNTGSSTGVSQLVPGELKRTDCVERRIRQAAGGSRW